jgi:sugar lactone lactonase YvrE
MMNRRILSCVAAAALAVVTVAPASAGGTGSGPPDVTYQVKEMIAGAQIHGANGLAIDTAGRLLVASVWGGEIVVVDPQTGAIRDRLQDGVDGADDVAIGPDGSIYWTDILAGEVGRRTPDGTVTKQLVAPGMNPIAFNEQGRLFVGQAFFGDGLFEVDPNLVAPPKVVIPDSGTPPFAAQLNGFDFGPDGMLYAPQPFLNDILRIDPETGTSEIVAAGLPDGATSVEFDAQGTLFASLFNGQVISVDTDNGHVGNVVTIRGAVLDNMVFDTAGRLLVSDSDSGAIYAVSQGRGVRTLVKGGLILPGGLAVMERSGRSESLYVADLWSLAEFDARSGRLIDVDNQSRAGGGIVEPWTVAPDDGNVIVTSWMSNAVQIWDPRANAEVQKYDFILPQSALRFQGDLVVAELGTASVVRMDANGTRTTMANGLAVPRGLAATGSELWVSDWATGLVWLVAGNGAPRVIASGLAQPEGMAVDRDGSLLVVESGAGRLSRIDPVTGKVSTVADGLAMDAAGPANIPPGYAFSSVAVDSYGTILVSGAGAEGNVIYRIRAIPAR